MSETRTSVSAVTDDYRAIFEATTDGVVISDMDGYVVEVNPAFCRISGYSRDELIGMHGTELTHPDSLYTVAESLRAVGEGGTLHYQGLGLRKDGSVNPAEVHVGTFTYRGQPHMLAVVRDITERLETEQELRTQAEQLREKEEQYRRIFESTSDGLIINDPSTGMVVEANPAVCRMHGYAYEEFIGLHATEFIHPDYHHVFVEFLETIVAGGTYQCEAIDMRKDGTTLHVEVHGSSVMYQGRPHILAVVRDITERVRARELLEQRVEERTRELEALLDVSRNVAASLEMAPLLNLFLDGLKGVVPYDGAAVLTLEGEELVYIARRAPTPAVQPSPGEVDMALMEPVIETIRGGETVIIDDVRGDTPFAIAFQRHAPGLMHSRHSYIRCWMGVPLMFRGRWLGILLIASSQPGFYTRHHADLARAIARQAAVAIENARLYEKAQEVAVLEERQRLSRELHDSVSQALYSIALGARTARALVDRDPARVAEPVEFVLTQAERALAEMRALIFELRPEVLEREGLVEAVRQQVEVLRTRSSLDVEMALDEELELPLPVKEALYRIAQEAMQNIVKHAGATQVQLFLRHDQNAIVLEIRDDGSGFDTGGSFPGHLGLRSMRERIERLGGTLEIESAAGAGTTVRARLQI